MTTYHNVISEHNLAALAERSYENKGDYESLLFEDRWHRSGELFERGRRLAAGLVELGVAPGERVVVSMANSPEVGIVYHALWRARAGVAPAGFPMPEAALPPARAGAAGSAVGTT